MPKEGKEKLLVVGLYLVFGYREIWFCLFGTHLLPSNFQYVSYCVPLFSKQRIFYSGHNTVFIESLAVET